MGQTSTVTQPIPAPLPASGRRAHAQSLFAGLPATYDVMAEALSFGQNGRWRRFLASRVPPSAGLVLDVATGTARVAVEVARRTPAVVVGLDQSEPMLRRGSLRTQQEGLARRIHMVLGNGERLPFRDGAFDAVTFTYLLRYVDDPGATLAELARVVRPGGTLASLEFHVPSGAVWRPAWRLYTRAVLPAAGRLVSRDWYDVGRFLGPSIEDLYRRLPLKEQLALWRWAGVGDARARVMSLGGGVVVWGRKDRS
jgi:demethylmenaquinone methyltransferase/2-methoxy-6-polyprenyl-1,4-benzoquinol methylase